LKGEVVGKSGANKKLVALAESGSDSGDAAAAVSFLQQPKQKAVALSTKTAKIAKADVSAKVLTQRMVSYLEDQAKKLKSDMLVALVIHMKEDHFVKVRAMLKDMIAKLESDSASEADQKSWCDGEMEKATSKRDESTGDIESDTAHIAESTSTLQRKQEEIGALVQEISELRKALNEATQLRTAESAENTKTSADATLGEAGVNRAIKILKDFYGSVLVQVGESYAPADADASGNTVGDLAPTTAEGEYEGNQDAAAGIVGQLQVIKSDFERTISQTNDDERQADSSYHSFETDVDKGVTEKEALVKAKRGEIAEEKSTLMDAEGDLKEHYSLKKGALDELAKLKPACVGAGSTYGERVMRREQEIESLKNAYTILNDMR